MIRFPNAKINLGLHITAKRPDGFHELESLFYPVDYCDALEVILSEKPGLSLKFSGLEIPGDPEKNLCYRAWALLNEKYALPGFEALLHKNIPMGAGLGGGSSDAAFMLKMLSEVASLNCNDEELSEYAARLGSDCAFFIRNQACLARGRGEILQPFRLSLTGYWILIVMPPLTVGTAEAYSWIKPQQPVKALESILTQPIHTWKDELHNDFEPAVFSRYPLIADVKKTLYAHKALYASMSGSGAAVFGIFEHKPSLDFGKEMIQFSTLLN